MLCIPEDLLRAQFFPFLTFRNLVSLDTAMCNKKHRIEWMKRFEGMTFLGDLTIKLNLNVLEWLSTRRMFVENIALRISPERQGVLNWLSKTISNFLLKSKSTDQKIAEGGTALQKTKSCCLIDCHITYSGVLSLTTNSPCLESLNMRCVKLSGWSSSFLAPHFSSNFGNTKLHSLNLSLCSWLTDFDVQLLVDNSPHLTALDLWYCDSITEKSLFHISSHCHGLKSLNVGWVESITDVGLIKLSQGCTQLEALNIDGCEQWTQEGLIPLLTACSQLNTLNLYRCGVASPIGWLQIIPHMQLSLTSLNLDHHCFVTDSATALLAVQCPRLRHLTVRCCTQLTDAAIHSLCVNCLELCELDISAQE